MKLLQRRSNRSQFESRVTSVLIIQLRAQLLQHQNSLFLSAWLEFGYECQISMLFSMYLSLSYNMICSASLCGSMISLGPGYFWARVEQRWLRFLLQLLPRNPNNHNSPRKDNTWIILYAPNLSIRCIVVIYMQY